MKIAIIGSGISGMACAYLLAPEQEITLFEANDYLGGHTHTIEVQEPEQSLAIDTGFIVYNERTYPHFIGLLDELAVATQPTEMGFSVRCHATDFEYNGTTAVGLISDRRNLFRPSFYRMVRDILRFYQHTKVYLQQADRSQQQWTVAEFAALHRYSDDFLRYHLLPMGAAIWSCNTRQFGEFPFEFVARFYDHHGLIQVGNRPIWRTLQGGSWQYVQKMLPRFADRIRLNSAVQKVVRTETGIELHTSSGKETFDHAILACHADTALKLVDQPDDVEQQVLSHFPYADNQAVLHTDISVLPKYRRSWASWNYSLDPAHSAQPTLTYNMNILQRLQTTQTYCVTLNETSRIDPAKVLGRYNYAHPLFSESRDRAQKRHTELIGRKGLSYCGAYWRNGFHEDGLISALRVCRQWGIDPGWSAVSIDAGV